jgi:DNA-binding XRE family transcriptional regulator
MTIKNLHQRKITAARRAEFAASLERLERRIKSGEGDAIANKLGAADLRSYITEFDRDLAEFDALATADEITVAGIAGIGSALIQARIASGLTQAALAERVGLKTAAINRYEANDYQSANLTRLHQIAAALDFDLHATLQRH